MGVLIIEMFFTRPGAIHTVLTSYFVLVEYRVKYALPSTV